MSYPFWFQPVAATAAPVTGVVSCNSLEWIGEESDRGINLSYEEGLTEYCGQEWRKLQRQNDSDTTEPPFGLIAQWTEEYNDLYEEQGDTYLIGDWLRGPDGKYEPDPALPEGFAAIVRYDGNVCQVVLSKWVSRGHYCSPCYPNQVDLDTPGDFLGYDFPVEMYGGNRQNSNPIEPYTAPVEEAN